MKPVVPELAPLLRSDAQGDLLALLLLHPDEEFSLSDVARRIGVGVSTVHVEVGRLITSGVLADRRVGQARLVRADSDHLLFPALSQLLELTYGPPVVLREVLAKVAGVRDGFIYGSWAARRSGEPGPVPRDIDVVVVGDTPRVVLDEAAAKASGRLHREVAITRIAPAVWDAGDDLFVRTLLSRPLVRVAGEPETSL